MVGRAAEQQQEMEDERLITQQEDEQLVSLCYFLM
jgi:hypothetical protein